MSDPFRDLFGVGFGEPAGDVDRLRGDLARRRVVELQARLVEAERLNDKLKRKAQWLIDRAYNKAIDAAAEAVPPLERGKVRALKRPVRHSAEFGG